MSGTILRALGDSTHLIHLSQNSNSVQVILIPSRETETDFKEPAQGHSAVRWENGFNPSGLAGGVLLSGALYCYSILLLSQGTLRSSGQSL